MRSFDIAFLRSFVAVAETGTMRAAGVQRARSTAAISQQVRTLEQLAGAPLFQRIGSRVVLSPQGGALLPFAREMIRQNDLALEALSGQAAGRARLGMPQDFADSSLAQALRSFADAQPGGELSMQVDRNSRVKAGELDVALLISRRPEPGATLSVRMPSCWLAREGFEWRSSQPLPLLVVEPPCLYREAAVRALKQAGIDYRIVLTSPSVSGVWAAVQAGLGVTPRMRLGSPRGTCEVGKRRLPVLPPVHLSLCRRGDGPAADALEAAVRDALADLAAAYPVGTLHSNYQ
jgi:DNA-binding transcriptional LysR family regulator